MRVTKDKLSNDQVTILRVACDVEKDDLTFEDIDTAVNRIISKYGAADNDDIYIHTCLSGKVFGSDVDPTESRKEIGPSGNAKFGNKSYRIIESYLPHCDLFMVVDGKYIAANFEFVPPKEEG